jgi:hypothetical protein
LYVDCYREHISASFERHINEELYYIDSDQNYFRSTTFGKDNNTAFSRNRSTNSEIKNANGEILPPHYKFVSSNSYK